MLNIDIKTIPHNKQEYETVGNYWDEADGKQCIRVSDMSDWRYEFLVAFHEMIEKALVNHRRIPNSAITDFDLEFEKQRLINEESGREQEYDEPGCDPAAPYHKEHMLAMAMEQLLALALDVRWDKYDKEVMTLSQEPAHA